MSVLARINESFVPATGYPLEAVLPVAILLCLYVAFEVITNTDRGTRFLGRGRLMSR